MTYILIHGAGDVAWYWHLASAELRKRGHEVVAVDLPCDDESARWSDYAGTVLSAIGARANLIVVAQSLGGFTAPLVAAKIPVELMVFVAAMIPRPGETAKDYWTNTKYPGSKVEMSDPLALFYHDVPRPLAEEALRHGRKQAEAISNEPWPLKAWPDCPSKFLLCRDDRLFPREWLREVVRDRLKLEPDEIESGHCPALARPKQLVDRLEAYARESRSAQRATET